MSNPLYKLTDQWEKIAKDIESGEITQEMVSDTLEGLEGELKSKAENCIIIAERIAEDVAAIEKEITRLQARLKKRKGKRQWLLDYVKAAMKKTGVKKIEGDRHDITLKAGPPIVVIPDEAALVNELTQNPEFIRAGMIKHSEKWSPDKNKIKSWLNDQLLKSHEGPDITTATIGEGAESLVIK